MADIALIGLGVMGRNLARNFADHGHEVAGFEPLGATPGDLEKLVASLARPRRVLLMVTAGPPVDGQIEALAPLLEAGDIVIDGGNSHFRDTERRAGALGERGIHYLGAGISGGAEGARSGASIMVGGTEAAYARVEPLLRDIAAVAGGAPCCAHLGPGGSGHFVKMIHNGIEYALMQAIAETACLLRRLGGYSDAEAAEVFAGWDRGDLASYLVGITAGILAATDAETGRPMLEVVLDSAGQKGTGRWTVAAAMDLGVPAPTLAEAVSARDLSALGDQRAAAGRAFDSPAAAGRLADRKALVGDLGDALLATSICAFAQGFAVLDAAARDYRWPLDGAVIGSIWRGGCIIRARLLEWIVAAFRGDPGLANLVLDRPIGGVLAAAGDGWRRTVAAAAANGVAAPAIASALAWFDGLVQGRGGADLIQAQRDRFGAHGFQRVDKPGQFHGDWKE